MKILVTILTFTFILFPVITVHAEAVDASVVFCNDVSGSINSEEFTIIREGHAQTITSDRILASIKNGYHQKIAVIYVEWSGRNEQKVLIPWTVIGSRESAEIFAEKIRTEPRTFNEGDTHIQEALTFCFNQLQKIPYSAERWIIDFVGDGTENGKPASFVNNKIAADYGVQINALAIGTTDQENQYAGEPLERIRKYYEVRVKAGIGAFVSTANNFSDFARVFERKFRMEIARN